MFVDSETTVVVPPFAIGTSPATRIGPKAVLTALLKNIRRANHARGF